MAFVALLDACVLYPAELRNLLLCVAEKEFYRPAWTYEILEEMRRSIVRNRPDLSLDRLDHLVKQMTLAFPEAMVEDYRSLVAGMTNHPGDRHVVAAAVRGRADVIVTFNVRHFGREHCSPCDLDVQTPDQFLLHAYYMRPRRFLEAMQTQVSRNQRPPTIISALLTSLESMLPELVRTLGNG